MRARSFVLGLLVPTTLSLAAPRSAWAEEPDVASSVTLLTTRPIEIVPPLAFAGVPALHVSAPSPFAPTPKEIRLSSGAITAIIIGGVILTVLVVAGAVHFSKPPKHP